MAGMAVRAPVVMVTVVGPRVIGVSKVSVVKVPRPGKKSSRLPAGGNALDEAAVEVGELGAGVEDHPDGLTGDGDLDDGGDHRAVEGEGDAVEIVVAFVDPYFVAGRVDDGVVGERGRRRR